MDQLDEIRQKLDIVELVSKHVTLKKAGRNFKALCPFHSEKTPSFIVSPERQIFKCFGCGIGGDIFKFFTEIEDIEFGEAVRQLAQQAGIELKSFRPSKEYEQKQRLLQINHLASEYFHYVLTQHQVGQKALHYLTKRGVNSDSIKNFQLGYAPDSWEGLLDWLVRKKGFRYQELEATGLAIRGRGWYARFRGRIIFPLADLQGNVVGFSGRVMDPQVKEAKYINSPETSLYHKSRHLFGLSVTKKFVKEKNRVVVVEGEMDVISSYQAGVKNVAAIKGSALTEEHVQLLRRLCETIILALDADEAGEAAMRRSLEVVETVGLNLKLVQLVGGKDPDELARNNPQAWKEAIKGAVSLLDFVIASALKRFGRKSPEAKRKVTVEIIPWLARTQNEVVKAHFVKKLAQALEVNEESVWLELEKQVKQQTLARSEGMPAKKTAIKSRQEALEEYLLALVVQAKSWQELVTKVPPDLVGSFAIGKILSRLKETPPQLGMVKFAQGLPHELQAVFDLAFLQDLLELDQDKREREFERVVTELEKSQLHARLAQLRRQLGIQGKKTNPETVKQFDRLLKRLQVLNHG